MSPLRRMLLIIALTAMWSPSFLFIKLALVDLPPMTIVSMRLIIASLIFGCILLWCRRPLPRNWLFWANSMILALFSSVFPFCLICFSETTIESALAAVLNGSSPMFTAILAHLFLPSDRLHFQKIAGVALSAAGLLFLFAPNIQEGFTGSSIGMLAAASAAMSYAISHVFAKKNFTGYQPFVVPAAQMICGSLILIPVALYFENPLSLAVPSLSAILGVCGLSCFGTVLAFIIYFRLIDHCGPTAISMVACFFPVVGMLLGFIFLKESLTWGGLAASALIFLGLAIVNEAINIKRLIPAFAKR